MVVLERAAEETDSDHLNSGLPPAADAWIFRWKVILTLRLDSLSTYEVQRTVHTPDELCDLVLHSSMDPRIVSYNYHRYAVLNIDEAPAVCRSCDERFDQTAPRQEWRNCACGIHVVYTCAACGSNDIFPRPTHACAEGIATLLGTSSTQ